MINLLINNDKYIFTLDALSSTQVLVTDWKVRGRFKNAYELVNLGARIFSLTNKLHTVQCMGKIFCVEFQREPLKFHTKYLTHTLKERIFIQYWKFRSFQIYKFVNVFETPPRNLLVKSTGVQSSNQLCRLDWMIGGTRMVVPVMATRVTCPIGCMISMA